jgi:hypothetical protein
MHCDAVNLQEPPISVQVTNLTHPGTYNGATQFQGETKEQALAIQPQILKAQMG